MAMKKLVAIVALAVVLAGMIPLQADAHGVGAAAVAFGAFVAFNALFLPFAIANAVLAPPVVYSTPAPVYAAAPVVYTPRPAPATSRQVVYPHGRYVLYGDGVSRPYQWIWIPNPPPPGSAPGY
jgi:hypothetical protein